MAIKHYFGSFNGRLAGVRGWTGGHYFTALKHEQEKIEEHPRFAAGLIKIIDDSEPKPRSTTVDLPSWEEHVRGLKWDALRDLAKERGVATFGKKAVQLIEELTALGG